jgi:hypothetical protein
MTLCDSAFCTLEFSYERLISVDEPMHRFIDFDYRHKRSCQRLEPLRRDDYAFACGE